MGGEKSEHLNSTDEAGEPSQGTRRREEGCRVMELQEGKMTGISSPGSISTKCRQIAELAKRNHDMKLWSLSRHIDIDWLKEAYRRTRKDGATGVDHQTADEYAKDLEGNLHSLLARAKTGTYRAPPVRRAFVPKGDGAEQRPIGIPTFEDKVLQRAAAMLLEAVFEQDFLDCSYGFRPGRNPHTALEQLWQQGMKMAGGWTIEVDIRKYFDTIDRQLLQGILRQRVADGVLLCLIGKWLNAGVMDKGQLQYPEAGTPQGGVVSPILANVFLHEVMDKWFTSDVKPRLKGRAFLVRYCDDLVMMFECEEDARRVMAVLPKRFGKFGLTLHPDKTRLVPFGSPNRRGLQRPGTFNFLGFTHYWGRTRRGLWSIQRRTASDRFTRALRRISEWCRKNRHEPIRAQQRELNQKLRGHYGYYGITGNSVALRRFRNGVDETWRRWLARRSQQGMSWERFDRLRSTFPLAAPHARHSVLRPRAKP